jgi:hypothetical protein
VSWGKNPFISDIIFSMFIFQGGILKYAINGEYVKMKKKPVKSNLKKENIMKTDIRKNV